MRLVPLVLLACSSTALAQPIASDGFAEPRRPREMWLPWGMLDRMQIAPPRIGATTEWSSRTPDAATTTLHAQASTTCDCRAGIYGTLPVHVAIDSERLGVAAAGSTTPIAQPPRAGFGTADVGVFISTKRSWAKDETIYRIGALLPTARAGGTPHAISARAQDLVLELPRSAGARFSTGHLLGFCDLPSSWRPTEGPAYLAVRIDTGLDLAYELDRGPEEKAMHVVPHAGLGFLLAGQSLGTLSLDTVLAMDPTDEGALHTRWSTGLTARLARPDGRGSWFHPAVTVAAVRTPEGWGGTIAVDLAVTGHRKHRFAD